MATRDDDDDEFDFSDGDLDALPSDTLRELERAAVLSTQRPLSTHGYSRTSPQARRTSYADYAADAPYQEQQDNYGYNDENVIDLNNESVVTTVQPKSRSNGKDGAQSNRAQNYQAPERAFPLHSQRGPRPYPQYSVSASDGHPRHGNAQGSAHPYVNGSHPSLGEGQTARHADSEISVADLRARILELENDRASLLRSVEESKASLQSKTGEIAIIRRNHEKAAQEFERRVAVIQDLHNESITKQNNEIEKLNRDRELAETNNRFLEHDLAQEAERSRNLRKSFKETVEGKPKTSRVSPSTPRKTRLLPLRDGFDDDDIVIFSPSRGKDRSKPSTPKAGLKRKRTLSENQSPGIPLALTPAQPSVRAHESFESNVSEGAQNLVIRLNREDRNYELLFKLLNYKLTANKEMLMETLSRFKIGYSEGGTESASSYLYGEITKIQTSDKPESTGPRACVALADTLERCLARENFGAVAPLVDALLFVLSCEPISTACVVFDKIVPLAIRAIDLVAIANVKAHRDPSALRDKELLIQINDTKVIDVHQCLCLLHTLALSCSSKPDAIREFWGSFDYDFVLIMLHRTQPLPQNLLMLRMLSTSALEHSVGPAVSKVADEEQQRAKQENAIIDRIVNLLSEKVKPYKSGQTVDPEDVYALRLECLNVLSAFCFTQYGGEALVRNRCAIGKLIRFLHEQLDRLYDFNHSTRLQTARAVNTTVRIVYRLTKDFAEVTDMRAKLNAVPGGSHKHLAALTRVAFSDSLILESGVEEEVRDAAHQMLDDLLSPEEGEALIKAFPSGRVMD